MIIRLLKLFGVLLLLAFVIAVLNQSVSTPRGASRRTQCKNNLKQIALALHFYHDTYKVFPPAYTIDENGNPLHSWRTLILPFFDQQPLYKTIDKTIDLSKPWNDPVNAEAYKTVVYGYLCPSAAVEATRTTYLAVVTPDSVIRPIQSCKMADVTDGTSNTLMVVEVPPEKAVHWMAPVDADEETLQTKNVKKKLAHVGGWVGALADGSVRFFSETIRDEQIHALSTVNGKDVVGEF